MISQAAVGDHCVSIPVATDTRGRLQVSGIPVLSVKLPTQRTHVSVLASVSTQLLLISFPLGKAAHQSVRCLVTSDATFLRGCRDGPTGRMTGWAGAEAHPQHVGTELITCKQNALPFTMTFPPGIVTKYKGDLRLL